jgi:hypothetical protein
VETAAEQQLREVFAVSSTLTQHISCQGLYLPLLLHVLGMGPEMRVLRSLQDPSAAHAAKAASTAPAQAPGS